MKATRAAKPESAAATRAPPALGASPQSPRGGLLLKVGLGVVIYQHPQLPFKKPQIESNRDHKALNRGTLGGLGMEAGLGLLVQVGFRPVRVYGCYLR